MTTKLETASDEDLEKEIQRRKKIASRAPSPLGLPNFAELQRTVIDGLAECVEKQYEDEDFKHWIYEAAMEAVYGKDFWEWRNKQKW